VAVQADAEGYASISSSVRMAPKARGDRRPSVPLRLYVRHSHGGDTSPVTTAVSGLQSASVRCSGGMQPRLSHTQAFLAFSCMMESHVVGEAVQGPLRRPGHVSALDQEKLIRGLVLQDT